MKYVFFGTPEFAAIILEKLIEAGYVPAAVVCNPDRPVGRKKIITAPAVKSLIMKHKTWNIGILQPEKLDKEFTLHVLDSMPDVFIVAAYAKILPKEILEIPRLGTIGVHPSLLPKYRGPSPVQAALLNGDAETGVTLYLMDEKIDHGAILVQRELTMTNDDDYNTLMKKLAELSGDLLIATLPKFIDGKITPMPQDETQVTYTKKFKNEDAFVDLEKDNPQMIVQKVRALNPEPGIWFMKDSKRTKILEAEIDTNGKLVLKKIQIEGQKPKNI